MGWINMRVVVQMHKPNNNGPWFVWDNGLCWFVVNSNTGRTKRIGRVGAKRTNNYDKAMKIAFERNEKEHRKDANQN